MCVLSWLYPPTHPLLVSCMPRMVLAKMWDRLVHFWACPFTLLPRLPLSCALGAVEVESLIDMLPNVVMSIRKERYEHLDTVWADAAKDDVFPKVWFRLFYAAFFLFLLFFFHFFFCQFQRPPFFLTDGCCSFDAPDRLFLLIVEMRRLHSSFATALLVVSARVCIACGSRRVVATKCCFWYSRFEIRDSWKPSYLLYPQ